MPNTKTCGTCKHLWPLQKGKRGGGTISLTRGYCLKRTTFPKNRPGNPVYPPNAVLKDTPNHIIESYIVRVDQIVPHCTDHTEK